MKYTYVDESRNVILIRRYNLHKIISISINKYLYEQC